MDLSQVENALNKINYLNNKYIYGCYTTFFLSVPYFHSIDTRNLINSLMIFIYRYKVAKDGRIVKNRVPVKFPKTNLQFGYSFYKLYAVPQHVGTTDAGHYYTTVLLDDVNDEWYTFNDEHYARDTAFETDNNSEIGPNCVGFFYVKTADCDLKTSKDINEEPKEN